MGKGNMPASSEKGIEIKNKQVKIYSEEKWPRTFEIKHSYLVS